jgi:hypothetical protein
VFCIDKWLWVTCYTQPCKLCKAKYVLDYLPQGDASSPRGRWGICAPALPEVLTSIVTRVHARYYIHVASEPPVHPTDTEIAGILDPEYLNWISMMQCVLFKDNPVMLSQIKAKHKLNNREKTLSKINKQFIATAKDQNINALKYDDNAIFGCTHFSRLCKDLQNDVRCHSQDKDLIHTRIHKINPLKDPGSTKPFIF